MKVRGIFRLTAVTLPMCPTRAAARRFTFKASRLGGGKWQVSTSGGWQPKWRRDGKELYYIAIDRKLMACPVKLDGSVEIGAATPLFQTEMTAFVALIDTPSRLTARDS